MAPKVTFVITLISEQFTPTKEEKNAGISLGNPDVPSRIWKGSHDSYLIVSAALDAMRIRYVVTTEIRDALNLG